MSQDRRLRQARVPAAVDRRRGDRRSRQAAVLDHRRAADRRLDAAGAALLLQRDAFVRRLQVTASRVAAGLVPADRAAGSSPPRVVALDAPVPAAAPGRGGSAGPAARPVLDLAEDACTEVVACPLCAVLFDPVWLFQHVAVDH